MELSPPRKGTWAVSILLGAAAILVHYGGLNIPIIADADFLLLSLSFLLLLLGVVLEAL